jgi:hypothetical protein
MAKTLPAKHCRNLVLVLGDQLNIDSAAFDGFDCEQVSVWMADVADGRCTGINAFPLKNSFFSVVIRRGGSNVLE